MVVHINIDVVPVDRPALHDRGSRGCNASLHITDENDLILSHSDSDQIGRNAEDLYIPLQDKDFFVSHIISDEEELILVSTSFTTSKQLIGFHWHKSTIRSTALTPRMFA